MTKVKQEREKLIEFLKTHPHMIKYQDDINKAMNAAGTDPESRMHVLAHLIAENGARYREAMDQLVKNTKNLQKELDKICIHEEEEQTFFVKMKNKFKGLIKHE